MFTITLTHIDTGAVFTYTGLNRPSAWTIDTMRQFGIEMLVTG